MTNFANGWGQRIYSIRASKKMTQGDFARGLLISKSYLSEIENERKKPSWALLNLISEAYGVSTEWIATGNPRHDIWTAYAFFTADPANYASDPLQGFVDAYNLRLIEDLLPVFVIDSHPTLTADYLNEYLLQGDGQDPSRNRVRTRFKGVSETTRKADPVLPNDWFSLCVELAARGLTPEQVREIIAQHAEPCADRDQGHDENDPKHEDFVPTWPTCERCVFR